MIVEEITLHAAAPNKPAVGAPCNGCGVCCAVSPCPLSRALLGHRQGACPALLWQEDRHRYVCGLAVAPAAHLRWLPRWLVPAARRLALRWIAASRGCDCDDEVVGSAG